MLSFSHFPPSPFHPFAVHFPVALLLLGTLVAIISFVAPRLGLARVTAALLVTGALGAFVANSSGEAAARALKLVTPEVQALLDAHDQWAERTAAAACVAAVAACGAAFLLRFPKALVALRLLTVLSGLVCSYGVYETGWRGSNLVHVHHYGPNAYKQPPAPSALVERKEDD